MLVTADLERCLTNIRKQRRIYQEGWERTIASMSEWSARYLEIQKGRGKKRTKKRKGKKKTTTKQTLLFSLYPASVGQWFWGHWHSLTSFKKKASVSLCFCYCRRNKLAAGLLTCFDSALLLFHWRTQGWHPETLFLGSHVYQAQYTHCQLDRTTKWLCDDPEATIPHTVQLVGAFMHTV